MLLGIGFWALRLALKGNLHTHEHEHDGARHLHIHTHAQGHAPQTNSPHRHTHAAFGIGTLHGLAGSSHFLGVLPALAFPTKLQAATYLLAFGLGTIAAMATFSWGMGWMAGRLGVRSLNLYRGLMGATAMIALGVGSFWLVTGWA
jgi:sulfite exporter TauE/SafE